MFFYFVQRKEEQFMELVKEIMMELQPLLLNALVVVIGALATWLGAKYRSVVNTKEKRAIVISTVNYVEQVAEALEIKKEEKFELAKSKALEWLNLKGFTISEVELEILIEEAVRNLKGE